MVQRSGEGPLLPEELAITIRAALGDQCQWAVSHSGETLHVDGIDRSGDRQSFRFGPPTYRVQWCSGATVTAIRQFLAMQGIEAVIPPRANRTETIHYDPEKYQLREKVERWFNKLKQFRRIATRYDKLSRTFLAFVHLAATWIMVR